MNLLDKINLISDYETKAIYAVVNNEIKDSIIFSNHKKIDLGNGFHIFISCDRQTQESIESIVLDLMPWRKGPFYIHFDNSTLHIDSEWRSDMKMSLLHDCFDKLNIDLYNKRVLDVGCNNGYYMFNLAFRVSEIIGIDPIKQVFLQYYLFMKLSMFSNISFHTLGMEDCRNIGKFDIVLCLGVLYHRREPLLSLKILKNWLNDNGILLLETLILDSDDELCLCPYPSYAGMKNVYFIFSPKSLRNLAYHAGFRECVLLTKEYTTNKQQRSSAFSKKSLGDLLGERSIEGYQAPCRAIFALKV